MVESADRRAGVAGEAEAMDRPTARGDIIAGLACLIGAAVAAVVFPYWIFVPARVAGTIDSPAVMPMLMLGALTLFGALLFAGAWSRRHAVEPGRTRAQWSRAVGMLAVCGFYLAAILLIGLPLGTTAALLTAMFYFGERRWPRMVAVAVLTPLLLWAFFAHVAHVPMPDPVWRIGLPSGPIVPAVAT